MIYGYNTIDTLNNLKMLHISLQSPEIFGRIADDVSDEPFTYDPMCLDMWCAGVSLYEAATGTLPFKVEGGRQNRAALYV